MSSISNNLKVIQAAIDSLSEERSRVWNQPSHRWTVDYQPYVQKLTKRLEELYEEKRRARAAQGAEAGKDSKVRRLRSEGSA